MLDIKMIKEHTKDLSVLYVEDDVSLMDTTHELLENFFPNIDFAFDGEEGLYKYMDYKKEHGKYYDLIITDINMPKMNGIAMSEKILKINYEQSIVIITAHNEIDYLSAALESGVDGFVVKPVQTEKLMLVISKVARHISNSKLVESHIALIEDLNMRLDMQNKELRAKNQELEQSNRLASSVFKEAPAPEPYSTIMEDQISPLKPLVDCNMDEEVNRITLSAVVYASDFPSDFEDKREKLLFMYEDLDSLVFSMHNSKNYTLLPKIGESIIQFAQGIAMMIEFRELTDSLLGVGELLTQLDVDNLEDSLKELLMAILDSSLSDLDTWTHTIFVDQSVEDIHYMDKSLIASFVQISTMLSNSETKTDDECQLEFF